MKYRLSEFWDEAVASTLRAATKTGGIVDAKSDIVTLRESYFCGALAVLKCLANGAQMRDLYLETEAALDLKSNLEDPASSTHCGKPGRKR